MQERALKATIAAFVLGAAVVAVWAYGQLRDGRPRGPEDVVAEVEGLPGPAERSLSAPGPSPRSARVDRDRKTRGKPVGPPQVMPPSRPVVPSASAAPAPPPSSQPTRPEEAAARRVLEPLVARRPNAQLPFVRCLDPGGWNSGTSENGESDDPLDVRARDPGQAVCRARLQARDREVLVDLLKDASGAYQGHLAATDPREHLDAYLGRWFVADVQLDTEEAHPLPEADP